MGVALGIGVAQHVDRVVVAPRARKEAVEFVHRLIRNRRQLAASLDERIGRQHARTARVGQDRKAPPFGTRLLAQDLGHVKQIGDRIDAEHAAAAKRGVEHVVGSGQRTRVARRRVGRLGRAPGLDDDDRLLERHLARRRQKRARVADRFHVEHDALGARIVAQVVDQIAPTHVEHRPDRHERRKANVLGERPVQDARQQRPALADERDRSRLRHVARERRVESVAGPHDAQAVGTDDAHVALARLGQHLRLELRALLADLLEARRDDDAPLDARRHALGDEHGHQFGRRHDDGQVGRFGQLGDAFVGANAQHVVALGVDRIDRPAERIRDQIPQDRAPDAPLPLARTDHGDALGRKDGVEALAAVGDDVVRRIDALSIGRGGGFHGIGELG